MWTLISVFGTKFFLLKALGLGKWIAGSCEARVWSCRNPHVVPMAM